MMFVFSKKSILTILLLSYSILNAQAQTPKTDTTLAEIAPIEIKAHFNSQAMLDMTSSARVVSKKLLQAQSTSTILSAMNSTPGIRMEERSPGSYRLALRGSMIRSPFGVRNTKIYLDEIPFTDASGNTYLNIIDPVGIDNIQIIKGPDGSLYGPNTGGVVRIMPNGLTTQKNNDVSLLLAGGSYGMFQEQLNIEQQVNKKYNFSFSQAFLRSDGYRDQSGLNKKFFQTAHQWAYSPKGELKFLALYADLGYETPGGLTEAQYLENPRQARPAGGPFPSAADQKAAIYNKTSIAGITHSYQFNAQLKHVIALFGSYTDFKNPFVTNYETRKEKNFGLRTYLSYEENQSERFQWEMQLGAEGQKGWYAIKNYENNFGDKGALNYDDQLENLQHFYFYRVKAKIAQRLIAEGSIGLNLNNIDFEQKANNANPIKGDKHFKNSWMPRLGLSYLVLPEFAIRASISKGYSTPTISEVRSSNNQINRDLNPEDGVNYEAGLRYETKNRRIIADLAAYQYRMKNGIVRQLDAGGAEYFNNAGEIDQKGIEASVLTQIISPEQGLFVRSLIFSTNLTYQDYSFTKYLVDDKDYTGNQVTSIPKWMWANTLSFELPKQFEINLYHNHCSSIPLNDANSFYAKKYDLLQAKLAWTTAILKQRKVQFFVGADNLLDEKYSLGNDINAMGNRFYNAAPPRNYYAGLKLMM
ncbi:TonB-dependent receptor [Sphingobacteruim zhuxiongii]|nr:MULTISPECIES: TonB-dependent receptor [unclassified Sphingobacterium]